MNLLIRLSLVGLMLATVGCATTPGVRFDQRTSITRIIPVVELDLVGTNLFRRHEAGEDTMTAEQLQKYFDVLFGTHNPRFGEHRFTIILYSYNTPPPDTIGREAEHIAPVLAAAGRYDCGVTIIYPEQAGISTVASYYEAFPSKQHRSER